MIRKARKVSTTKNVHMENESDYNVNFIYSFTPTENLQLKPSIVIVIGWEKTGGMKFSEILMKNYGRKKKKVHYGGNCFAG